MDYQTFLESKIQVVQDAGFDVNPALIHPMLFPFQRDLIRWSLRKGRAAIFADTGLGKTYMQLEWARLVPGKVLIIAPLSVARQTARMAADVEINPVYVRSADDVLLHPGAKIYITNYEMIDRIDFSVFSAVVLDESSILKSIDGKTRERLVDLCSGIQHRLCCTATPAPNDIVEIGNHSEFLGIKTMNDMRAEFFVHDDNGYRLKGHSEDKFFQWLASWGMSVRKPSDIGEYSDDGYILPELRIEPVFVETNYIPEGQLFATEIKGITGRSNARKGTMTERCIAAADLVNADTAHQWVVWCGLDAEQAAVTKLIPDCVSVYGSHSPDEKAQMIEDFQDGKHRVLITKARIAGFGMNLQNAARQAFVGLGDSYEQYYQCIRRSHRFGQTEPVTAYVVLSSVEDVIFQNVLEKERQATRMSEKLIENVQRFEKAEIGGETHEEWEYKTDTVRGAHFTAMLGDSCERMKEIEDNSIDLSVYSPPFMSLYSYSPSERDLGNSHGEEEFFKHFQFIIQELLRVTKPGRLTACHVAQVPAMLVRDGYIGLKDFRGKTIQAFIDAGWIQHGEVVIDKDPQAQAIRTKAKALLFTQMHKDSSWSRPALADFVLWFRKPGENQVPIVPDLTNDEWIEWARPIWYGIKESDTLQYTTAREEKDERHICPLQLGTIERVIRLHSNKGERVLSPFMGIGSEGHEALRLDRDFVGIELKQSYWASSVKNLREAERMRNAVDLFDWAQMQDASAD